MKSVAKGSFKNKVNDIKNSLTTYLSMAELDMNDDDARKRCKKLILKDKDVNADLTGFVNYLETEEKEGSIVLKKSWDDVEEYKIAYENLEASTPFPTTDKSIDNYSIDELDVEHAYHKYRLESIRYEQTKRNVSDSLTLFIKDVINAMVESKKRAFSDINNDISTPRLRINVTTDSTPN